MRRTSAVLLVLAASSVATAGSASRLHAQDPDLVWIGGDARQSCESTWMILRRAVVTDYANGNWDELTGRAKSASPNGMGKRAGRAAPQSIRERGLQEIDHKLAELRRGIVPADPERCGPAGLPPLAASTRTPPNTERDAVPSYEACENLVRYRDGLLFGEWHRALSGVDILNDKISLLQQARNDLVADAGAAASNWGGAGATFAATVKTTADLILDLSGPAGAAARASVKPLDQVVKAVKTGNTGEGGSLEALKTVVADAFVDELRRLHFVAGALANLSRNSYQLARTVDGWKHLRGEYEAQLRVLDRDLAAARRAIASYRTDQRGLEALKQRVDSELANCRIYDTPHL